MEFIQVIIIMVGIYVILASSFNFVIGYGGLISVAHPAFFALGAYTSGILARDLGWPVLMTMPIAATVAVSVLAHHLASLAEGVGRLPDDCEHRISARSHRGDQACVVHRRPRRPDAISRPSWCATTA